MCCVTAFTGVTRNDRDTKRCSPFFFFYVEEYRVFIYTGHAVGGTITPDGGVERKGWPCHLLCSSPPYSLLRIYYPLGTVIVLPLG